MVMNLMTLRDCDSNLVDPSMYHKLIGSLNYPGNTRLDSCYVVNTLSQFLVKPQHIHWVAAKHILRYIHGTIDYGLRYVDNGEWKMHGFTDAYWAGCTKDRNSTFSFCFSLGFVMMSWSSKKETSIALSAVRLSI